MQQNIKENILIIIGYSLLGIGVFVAFLSGYYLADQSQLSIDMVQLQEQALAAAPINYIAFIISTGLMLILAYRLLSYDKIFVAVLVLLLVYLLGLFCISIYPLFSTANTLLLMQTSVVLPYFLIPSFIYYAIVLLIKTFIWIKARKRQGMLHENQ